MATQTITLYTAASGPNSWKVAMILRELDIPYKIEDTDYRKLHEKPFTDINPNGRAPALHDPNTNITLWESSAIIEYLIEQYDRQHEISHATFPEKYLEKQYSFYQASGQGPYFGQGAWFQSFHHESLPSAKERYDRETRRVVKVLDGILEKQKYLVGEKITYADLAYFWWNVFIDTCVEKCTWNVQDYPNFKRWQEEMAERPSAKVTRKERKETMAAAAAAAASK